MKPACALLAVLPLAAAAYSTRTLAPGVLVVEGPVNGVVIERAGRRLTIYGDPRNKPLPARKVLFTEARRDVAWAGRALVTGGAEAVVPAVEAALFSDPQSFWERFRSARFHDYTPQTSKIPADPFARVTPVRGGERIKFEGLEVEVLDTPGYTRGAVSYLFEAGKRIACTGDLIYGDGKLLDLYSLQDAIPQPKEDGYHGWAARAHELIASLRKIAAARPDVLVPARGPVIDQPRQAIDRLIARLQAAFASHFEIDALRWYRGDENIRGQEARVLDPDSIHWMPMAETRPKLPDWIVAISNSRLILSSSGAAFLVDCGSRRILDQVQALGRQGRFRAVEGIWITHYHDDHTDMAQAAAEELHCPVYASGEMQDILEHPERYRMPAETANPIRSVTATREGQTRRWHEFEFTYSWFPGQTLYHDGLLVKKDGGETVFFIGDSFTPTGIDDYCLLNRNFLDPKTGFLRCLNALKSMPPGYLLINQHVAPVFRFSAAQIERMLANLEKRGQLLRDLFPWDDPDFGLDEEWARFYPYGSEVPAGKPFELKVAIWNHLARRQEFRVTPHVPAGWNAPRPVVVAIGPRQEGMASFRLTPPAGENGVRVVTADVAFGRWDLREWTEALVRVGAQ